MNNAIALIVDFSWLIFIVFWIFSAIGAKETIKGKTWIQIAFFAFFIIATRLYRFKFFLKYHSFLIISNQFLSIIGVIICVVGIVFAICSKWYLGNNWGMPITLKKRHELVTSGPYHLVRHPIYAGIILGIFGSALVFGNKLSFVLFPLFCVYFIYSAIGEERIMMEQFPSQYPDYKNKTKMFIPFIF